MRPNPKLAYQDTKQMMIGDHMVSDFLCRCYSETVMISC